MKDNNKIRRKAGRPEGFKPEPKINKKVPLSTKITPDAKKAFDGLNQRKRGSGVLIIEKSLISAANKIIKKT